MVGIILRPAAPGGKGGGKTPWAPEARNGARGAPRQRGPILDVGGVVPVPPCGVERVDRVCP
jgi:hypothetical protein